MLSWLVMNPVQIIFFTDDKCYFVDLTMSRIPKQQPKVTYKGTVKIVFKGILFLIDTLL